jgi:hypothetical protein
MSDSEKARSRIMLVDAAHRIIASSDGLGILTEKVPMATNGAAQGCYQDPQGATVAFHATPGYETYQGLGWYGVIVQRAP